MRIVTKTNLALAGVVAVAALLNFGVLETTIMPRFLDIESQAAKRNQSRVIEAIQVQKDQVAASARDYAFWDDSYLFMQGQLPDYEEKNVSAESLKALNVNFFLAIDASGAIRLDKGFDYSGEEPRVVQLLPGAELRDDHPLRRIPAVPDSQSGLVRTELGLIAVGYAPVLTTEREGPVKGTLAFGKLLDVEALRQSTRVDFELLPIDAGAKAADGVIETSDAIRTRTVIDGIDGKPLAVVVSKTDRLISLAGRQAIWVAMSLLAVGGALLIVTLAVLLRRIVIARVERMRSHLMTVADTGSLDPLPADGHGDELSDTVETFNRMAAQLAELRETLRRRDYNHGAADHAAGTLHNIRNAVSPISAIAWDLLQSEDAAWKQNLTKAMEQLADPDLEPARAQKLNQFVVLSAARLVEEGAQRKAALEDLGAMVRHVDRILKDDDAVSQSERMFETIDLRSCVATAAVMIRGRTGVELASDLPEDARVTGHRIPLEQVLANLLVNAAEAIDAKGGDGSIKVSIRQVQHAGGPALDVQVRDTGDGIPAERLGQIFEKGFSTRRERSSGLGLHWCANAVNAMKGRLYAESEGADRGATLHLVLPAPAASALKEAA
ncbi:CHASE4 domain-containing protein [Mangrovicella endophytica]|uniref:sensor histidine kinase n=1 Tax=Mangrovicella endophytica TaxID=2066697 RepID=UPI000C9E86E2|nr:CHASE4 domain-containing protein [Mangrovicella endophytica]